MKELFYFTHTFPVGKSANWKAIEIEQIAKSNQFSKIHIVPFIQEKKASFKYSAPKTVSIHEPLIKKWPVLSVKKIIPYFVLSPRFLSYLKLFIQEKPFRKKKWLIHFFVAVFCAEEFFNSKLYKDFIKTNKNEKVLYFFWGVNAAYAVPFLNKKNLRIFIRYHGYDLYKERNANYIPFRKAQLKNITSAIYVSEAGKSYQKNIYPKLKFNKKIIPLPVYVTGKTQSSKDKVLRILTCSRIIKLKRLDLLIAALNHSPQSIQIEWTHIGDGELFSNIKSKSSKLPSNINCIFKGWLSPEEINNFYNEFPIDLFLNLSTTEGMPTSIIEALGHGIPVIATDAGGTKEIIDSSAGKLIPVKITPEDLWAEIENFYFLDYEGKQRMKKNAAKKYNSIYSNQNITTELSSC